jgi:hypothetical protein
MVLLTWQHHYNHRTNAISYFELVIAPLEMVLLTLFHHCNGGTNTVPPLGEGKLTLGTKMFFSYVSSTIAKVQHGWQHHCNGGLQGQLSC